MKARLAAENHRGALVPRTLGLWLAGAALVSSAAVASTKVDGPVGRAGWGALTATLLVFAVGLIDDLAPIGPRGLRNHLRSLAAARVTTGILKLVVVLGAAVVVVALEDVGSTVHRLAGVVLVAGCANLWNGLDVRPGRALKFAIPAMLAASVFLAFPPPPLPFVVVAPPWRLLAPPPEGVRGGGGTAALEFSGVGVVWGWPRPPGGGGGGGAGGAFDPPPRGGGFSRGWSAPSRRGGSPGPTSEGGKGTSPQTAHPT